MWLFLIFLYKSNKSPIKANANIGDFYMETFTSSYNENLHTVNKKLRTGENFDVIVKRLIIGTRKATMFCIDGFVKDVMLEKMMEYLTKLTEDEMVNTQSAEDFVDKYITYIEADTEEDSDAFITLILTSKTENTYCRYGRSW